MLLGQPLAPGRMFTATVGNDRDLQVGGNRDDLLCIIPAPQHFIALEKWWRGLLPSGVNQRGGAKVSAGNGTTGINNLHRSGNQGVVESRYPPWHGGGVPYKLDEPAFQMVSTNEKLSGRYAR